MKLARLSTRSWTRIRRKDVSLTFSAKSLTLIASYEFGGPWGVAAIMTGFPILMYYLWICLWFHDGKLVHPASRDDIVPFLWRMWAHIEKVNDTRVRASVFSLSAMNRMPARIFMPGKCTLAISFSSFLLHGFFPDFNKRVFRFHPLATKP